MRNYLDIRAALVIMAASTWFPGCNTCSLGENRSTGCDCPHEWWEDIEMPENPENGLLRNQETIEVCSKRMPDGFFKDFPECWENADYPGGIQLWYDEEEHELKGAEIMISGVTVRADGVVFHGYDDDYSRMSITHERIDYYRFEIARGLLEESFVWIPCQ